MLVIQGLTRRFGTTTAVDNLNLEIPRGAFIGVIGRSGAGKSTMLRMINRLQDPSAGQILWQGKDITTLRGTELLAWRARCAMVFQQFNLSPRLDVLTNVLVGRLHHVPTWRALLRMWPQADRAIALSALEQFGMGPLAAQAAGQLSGGQQQRVALARALVQEPELILADEPVASLDPRNAEMVMQALADINRRYGITVLCNLHSLDLARRYCSRLVGLANGQLVFDDVPAALTDAAAQTLYGIEARDVMDSPPPALPSGFAAAVA
jgi:phosphonate transport system ATP-binding protein